MTASDHPDTALEINLRLARNVVFKGLFLFLIANLVFAQWYPLASLGRVSAYNKLFPGRLRLPYGDDPQKSYNLSTYNLEAMFASHQLSAGKKPVDEFRVIVIGDSSTWGYLLANEQTLTTYLNERQLTMPDGRQARFYNLGYPVMSVMKDLLILSYAIRYQPDLILWPLTLESMPYDKQLYPPLLQNNPEPVRSLIKSYHLNLNANDPGFTELSFWDRTLAGARRPLADWLRLQIYGLAWAATGVDQETPSDFKPRLEDLPADTGFHNLQPPHLEPSDLALDILSAGIEIAGDTPVLLINEPMFISQGENSDIRYNFYYPRWAYDDYRQILRATCTDQGWHYLDVWDSIPAAEFTNTAVHMTPSGTNQFADLIAPAILSLSSEGQR
ncbi:MAG: hypothetical protein A2W35_07975 [Chloroflexi bacterium RBG_16_57_11]|nr:MAG: hypothetical protein A2W35_07975 [Chloroflexi bacterium RBG_16_57_11]